MLMQTEQKIYYISDDDEKQIKQVHVASRDKLPSIERKYKVNKGV